jgi:glycosyltransferase involved in cell wall biosynthesis
MRLVYIHQYFRTRGMWGGTRSYEVTRRLAAHGHEVHVITTDVEAPKLSLRWRVTDDDGVLVHWLPVPYSNYMSYRRRIAAFAQFAVCASIESARLKPDVVLATSTPLTVAVPGMFASRVRRVPFVFEVRDLWPELPIEMGALSRPWSKRLAFGLARLTYRNADRVVALSPGMASGVESYGYPPERITVIPNGCDLDLFSVDEDAAQRFRSAYTWLGDRPLVVYAGTFGAINGVDYLVRVAAAALRLDPEVRFLMVGEGRELPKVTELAAELGVLDRNLFILAPVAKQELPELLAAATVATSMFLPMPKMWDNSANKFFDALAAGRPVAINYGGWQADLLRESGAGVVLNPEDVPGAAKGLVSRVRDTAWLAEAASASRHLAATQFSRDELFGRFEAMLRGVPPRRIPSRARRGRRLLS